MTARSDRAATAVAVVLALGCGAAAMSARAEPTVAAIEQPIIYGRDDRKELYAEPQRRFRRLAKRSVVALVPPGNLIQRSDGSFVPVSAELADVRLCDNEAGCIPVCDNEPFVHEPSVADCSGVLVDDDLVLTAGHCFSHVSSCAAYAYVFNFYYEAPGELAHIGENDVYGCRRIVHKVRDGKDVSQDYALIQLDRPVDAQRKPVTLRAKPLSDGDEVVAIGFPIGLPMKIDDGGIVQDARPGPHDYFTATTDTFVGNSGSAIFDAQGRLAGHLVLGGEDFRTASYRGIKCLRSAVVPDDTKPPLYEHSVYNDVWLSWLCDSSWPSERLCGAIGDGCGDGICAGKETQTKCKQDCGTPLCDGADCARQAALLPPFQGTKSHSSGGCDVASGRSPSSLFAGLCLAGALVWRARRWRGLRG